METQGRTSTLYRQGEIITLFCLAFWIVLLIRPGGSGHIALIDSLVAVSGSAIAACLCFDAILRSRQRPVGRGNAGRSPHIPAALILIGMASLCDLEESNHWPGRSARRILLAI